MHEPAVDVNAHLASLPREEVSRLRHVFAMLDRDGNGALTVDELQDLFGIFCEDEAEVHSARELLQAVDVDGDGTMDFGEFVYFMTSLKKQQIDGATATGRRFSIISPPELEEATEPSSSSVPPPPSLSQVMDALRSMTAQMADMQQQLQQHPGGLGRRRQSGHRTPCPPPIPGAAADTLPAAVSHRRTVQDSFRGLVADLLEQGGVTDGASTTGAAGEPDGNDDTDDRDTARGKLPNCSSGSISAGLAHELSAASLFSKTVDARLTRESGQAPKPAAMKYAHLTTRPNAFNVLPTFFGVEFAESHGYRVSPTSLGYRAFMCVIIVLVLSECIITPVLAVFYRSVPVAAQGWLVFCEVMYAADMLLTFIVLTRRGSDLIYDARTIAADYLRGYLVPDVVSIIPWFYILDSGLGGEHHITVLLCVVLIRTPKIIGYSRRAISTQIQSLGSRVMQFTIALVVFTHGAACLWAHMASMDGETWATAYGVDFVDTWTMYTTSLYAMVILFTSVGFGDIVPVTNDEKLLVVVLTFASVIGFSFLIAQMTSIISTADAIQSTYEQRLRAISSFMNYKGIPSKLQQQVFDYYEHRFAERELYPLTESVIFNDLADSLRNELAFAMHADTIRQVSFLKDRDDTFIRVITSFLSAAIFAPGDDVVVEGEQGDFMFFITDGTARVWSEAQNVDFGTLSKGDMFGELALLLHKPRSATVTAITHLTTYVLSRADLASVLSKYPDIARSVRLYALSHHYAYTASQADVEQQWDQLEQNARKGSVGTDLGTSRARARGRRTSFVEQHMRADSRRVSGVSESGLPGSVNSNS